ncbi:acetolactate synthase, small subunit [Flavobacterium aquidurense]|uniref:Acetolactate synthase small subunit n=1 Tax=Flavobacterium frigidimaris TaxID=262320 RepID=A0ABX4BWQ2_FLAFR|nr:acetolactate synthase small subunit [Flavobacterium frigidimaris]OXA82099.1 acetolactate synthase small subunit [Flavobacterium frigidimaris]SDY52875.1 acetolactate synthase, small subunit [Flavobacterium aquidurense]
MKKQYTFTIYAEDQVQLFQKITLIFSRKKIKIESFNFSSSEVDQISRFTIVVTETYEIVKNLVPQIEKIIEVYKCYCNTNEDIIWKQIALFKVLTSILYQENLNFFLNNAAVTAVSIERDYTIFQATGNEEEINDLVVQFSDFNLIEFVKSPRIALIRKSEGFAKELSDKEREEEQLFV